MPDWTPAELAAEKERMAAVEATGKCPFSGYTIAWCWTSDLCDCAYGPPAMCLACRTSVWDLPDHQRRMHHVHDHVHDHVHEAP
jgi:hypothetical protein